MKLKTVKTVEEKKHEDNVRRGKNSKRKGGQYERTIAKYFKNRFNIELKRTPQSGGFAKKSEKAEDYRGDVSLVDSTLKLLLHIECKDCKTINLPKWIAQSEEDCPEGRTPLVVFHKFGTSKNYVCSEKSNFWHLIYSSKKELKTITTEKPLEEEWLPITDFEGYFVSNLGQVISIRPRNGKGGFEPNNPRVLKAGVDNVGYNIVVLRDGVKSTTKRIHKLVAKEFLGIDNEVVNHIDGDKTHNWVTNLEKSSYSENLQHAYNTGLRKKGEEMHCAKLSDKQAFEIRTLLELGTNSKELESLYNISNSTITRLKTPTYRNPYKLYVEGHNQKSWSVLKWLEQAEENSPKDMIPLVVFHRHGTSKDYVCLSLEDFLNLIEKDKVVEKRKFK